ncbi:MAG: cytochrome ubiquinol oxidase subunit I, partial [Armatimonadetes bacterium]|nr:cytochrome ubiquinol oxidase subunit I [Armatimonadota bacterium]
MNYPHWDVPILGSGLVIALIAIFHVFVSHFAVGGGFFLPMMESAAVRQGKPEWLEVLRKHTKFFLILTGVFGAVTGVAIWFAIGLASPEGTSTLIHYWVFGWAMEWGVFLIELTTIAVYYYLWDKVDRRTHIRIGWLYAISSWLTLVIINGILTFMLTPTPEWLDQVGSGSETYLFWHAFFNATYWPSLIARTLICLSLAGVYALITASRLDGETQGDLKVEIIGWSRRWMLPAFCLLPFVMAWYVAVVPPESRALLTRGIANSAAGQFGAPTRMALGMLISSFATVVVAYLWTGKHTARDFGLGAALGIAFCAYAAFGTTEMTREMLRKPYVISKYSFSNGTRPVDTAELNAKGYLTNTILATPEQKARWAAGNKDLYQGELMYRGQCLSCHTVDGYRSMRKLLAGRDRKGIENLLQVLHEYKPDSPYIGYMPPLVGTALEIEALGDYLATLSVKPETAATAAPPAAA